MEDRHVIPEDRIGGGANLLSLPGSQGGQEGFQFMGEKREGVENEAGVPTAADAEDSFESPQAAR